LGLNLAKETFRVAYLASRIGTKTLQNKIFNSGAMLVPEILKINLEEVKLITGENSISFDDFKKKKSQKWGMELVNKKKLSDLNESASNRDLARRSGCSGKYSGEIFNTLPNKELGTFVPNREFQGFIKYRLGIQVYHENNKICKRCGGKDIDGFGDHALNCKNGTIGPITRHNHVKAALAGQLKRAGIVHKVEEKVKEIQGNKKPQDITILEFSYGKQTDIDVAVPSVVTSSYLNTRTKKPGAITEKVETSKHRKYKDYYEKNKDLLGDREFLVFALDTLGGYGAEAVHIMNIIAYSVVSQTNISQVEAVRKIRQSISADLVKFIGRQFVYQI